MSNVTGVYREGWHLKKKDGGRDSIRAEYKGVNQVAGWVGKGKPSHAAGHQGNHTSRPLASLKDPAAFAPPPKNVNFHGGAALPNERTPDRRGLGAPLSSPEVETAQKSQENTAGSEVDAPSKPAASPVPFSSNRTGLKTDYLLPPPSSPAVETKAQEPGTAQAPPRPKPSLPPRLPPRNNSAGLPSPRAATSPPPAYESVANGHQSTGSTGINQNAVNRLGKAGISVPGLGIGQSDKSPSSEGRQSATSPTSHLSSLNSHFSRINVVSPPAATSPGAQSESQPQPQPQAQAQVQAQGTTLAEKQAAVKTAQSLHNDPSSISVADAQSAASTANNFRNRHGHEISSGAQKANSWNSKYNIAGRANGFLGGGRGSDNTGQQQHHNQNRNPTTTTTTPIPNQTQPAPPPPPIPATRTPQDFTTTTTRKPAPPLPNKKPTRINAAPPPVPLGTKPSRTKSTFGYLPVSNSHNHETGDGGNSGGDGGGGGFGG